MKKIIRTVLAMDKQELDRFARTLAWASAGTNEQATRLEFLLNAHNREQKAKREQSLAMLQEMADKFGWES